jgi:hypothetical protein
MPYEPGTWNKLKFENKRYRNKNVASWCGLPRCVHFTPKYPYFPVVSVGVNSNSTTSVA